MYYISCKNKRTSKDKFRLYHDIEKKLFNLVVFQIFLDDCKKFDAGVHKFEHVHHTIKGYVSLGYSKNQICLA